MKALQLEAKKREIRGRKVKNLRSEGVLPATVYGDTTDPLTIQVARDEFDRIYKQSGETGLINLMVDGGEHPVLVKNVQIDPVSGISLHVEFHQVNLKEKIRANVPVEVTGQSQTIKEKVGTLLQLLNEIEVEALPSDLPDRIEVDISKLVAVGDHILIKELVMPEKVAVLTDPEIMVVKIGELLAPEPEPEQVAVPAEGEAVVGEPGEEGKTEQGSQVNEESPEKSETSKKE